MEDLLNGVRDCVFCRIAAGTLTADKIYEDSDLFAFLDSRPLFPGHVLLCPRVHCVTLIDLPLDMTGPMMKMTQLLAKAVEAAVSAEGTFIAINNRISQSVPHLHIHVVPRRKRDGLKGFFWPRKDYRDAEEREVIREAIEREVKKLLNQSAT